MGVDVGMGVLEGCGVGVFQGVGVHVGGILTGVYVEVGISMVAGSVAGGNGLTEEVGSLKIVMTIMITMTVAIKTRTERTSQILMFNFICQPPQTGFPPNFVLL
jgi:hypothetical protein